MASNSPHEPWTHGDASAFDRAALSVPGWLADTPQTRETLRALLRRGLTHFDVQVGAILDALERAGRTSDTLVLYTSEQGASLPFAKWTLDDAGIKTAMVVRWPGKVKPGAATGAMVAYVDVLPTRYQAAGVDPGPPISTAAASSTSSSARESGIGTTCSACTPTSESSLASTIRSGRCARSATS